MSGTEWSVRPAQLRRGRFCMDRLVRGTDAIDGGRLPGAPSAAAPMTEIANGGGRLTAVNDDLARHEAFWVARLARLEPIELPYANRAAGTPDAPAFERRSWTVPPHLAASADTAAGESTGEFLLAAFALYL